jgi:peptide-methionine (S)-S-oxide reductase
LEYDPKEVAYEELLKLFFNNHIPEYDVNVRQYASAIFYHDDSQRKAALTALEQAQQERGAKIHTIVMPFEIFYLAEPYHQKYYLQMVDILKSDIKSCYPRFRDFIDSTAAARINGYLKGLGSIEGLMEEIDALGLSDKGKKRLIEIVDSY